MRVLHAVWTDGEVFLWCEGDPGAVADELGNRSLAVGLGTPIGTARKLQLQLPTVGRKPLSSPLLAEGSPRTAPVLKPHPVEGLALTAGEAARHLGEGDYAGTADATRVWALAARWVRSLVARERFIPGAAGWTPILDDPKDEQTLDWLAQRLPPAGRPGLTARAALQQFAQRAIAELVPQAAPLKKWPRPARRWLEEWVAPEEVLRWLDEGAACTGYRTLLRLEEPGEAWRLTMHLQAQDDPSLQIPATAVWATPQAVPQKGRLHPQDRLLRDLGRALPVLPELHRALQDATPTELALGPAETVEFLKSRAATLQEMGLAVQLPRNLRAGRQAVGLKMRAKGASGPREANAKALGMAQLVDYQWQVALGDETMDPDEFRRLADLKTNLVKHRGQWVLLDADMLQQALAMLQRQEEMELRDVLQLAATGAVPVQVHFEGDLAPLQGEAAMQLLEPPEELNATLRPYQVRGYSWLSWLGAKGLGACLADDMGLGKTVQTLARLLREPGGPVLLVCPTSVLGNWVREVERFAPSLEVEIHHGTTRVAKPRGLVLTTYGRVRRDVEDLARTKWRGIILDEAQNVKNPEAGQARAVRSLKAGWRVALTGTPVENRLTDLWSLMEFLNPGLLGTRAAFQRDYVVPVQRWGQTERLERLKQVVQPFLLRRVKSDPTILPDLPEKQEIKTWCNLTKEQATLYEATVQEMLVRIEGAEGIDRRGHVLTALLRLKQICNHPAQFLDDGSPLPGRSGKLERLEEMLEEVLAEGDRALIFTQFAGFARELARYLRDRFQVETPCLHGALPRVQRDALVERFQAETGPPLLVLSLKAGGVGLNLTRASRVFHFDRWWNPAVENQATDRAWRFGQTKGVQVYKFLCAGTVEEAVDRLIDSKVALAASVVGAGEGWLTELDDSTLREVLSLK